MKELDKSVSHMEPGDPRGQSHQACKDDQFANSIFTAFPSNLVQLPSPLFQEAGCNHMGMPSPISIQHGLSYFQVSRKSMETDAYGYNIKAVTGVKGGHRTTLHNAFHSVIANSLHQAGIIIKGKLPSVI
jgi:hypothetical protein